MTKRLIALLMVLVLAISVASMALGDGWDQVYPASMGVGGERGGGWSPKPPVQAPAGDKASGPSWKVNNRVNLLY